MTELNKLRSEFEATPEIEAILEVMTVKFVAGFYVSVGFGIEIYTPYNALLNFAWDLWQEKAKAQAVPVWVSTEFMLPDDNDYVDILINGKRRIVDAVYLEGKFFIFPPFSKEQWTEVNNKVTHWMPRVDVVSQSGAEG